jgi:hypothetical protein
LGDGRDGPPHKLLEAMRPHLDSHNRWVRRPEARRCRIVVMIDELADLMTAPDQTDTT